MRLPAALFACLLATSASAAGEYNCLIEAYESVDVRSPVEALIESILVRRGDVVKKGQVLVRLESAAERAGLDLAKARATMQGEIKAAEARVDLARRKHARAEELFKQNFVSSTARDEAEAEFKLASEQLRQAQEARQLAELEARRSSELVAMRTLRSPFAGVVVEKLQSPGEMATTNINQPILKLARIDPLHVEVVLPVSEYGKIRNGMKGLVVPEKPIEGRYEAIVKVVDRTVDAASGTFGARLELPNPKAAIPAGVKCRVRFG
ncbi:MAG TPA: efflux RND transporter periplasmic adaptor subunit [Burkholderiales bacterium]|jgi:RND family efflux transporter MFP subunit